MEEQPAEGPAQDALPPVFRSGDPVEVDSMPISRRPRSVVVAIVAALAVAAVGVLVLVRVGASGDHGTPPAPDNQVVVSSAQSGQPSTSGNSTTPASGDVRSSGSLNVGPSDGVAAGPVGLPGDSADGRLSGSVNVTSDGGEVTSPVELPGDGGELPGG